MYHVIDYFYQMARRDWNKEK